MEEQFLDWIKTGEIHKIEDALDRDPGLMYEKTDEGLSSVLLAVYNNHPEIARLIINRGKILDIYEAAAAGDLSRMQVLIDEEPERVHAIGIDGFQPLGLACFFGHLEIVDLLVTLGAQIDSPSRNQLHATPLQSATAAGHINIVRMLLEHGADPNVSEAGGFTPLQTASASGNTDLVRLLMEHGASLDAQADNGKTALQMAQENGHSEIVELLNSL
jgi:ankyrin repeat protein